MNWKNSIAIIDINELIHFMWPSICNIVEWVDVANNILIIDALKTNNKNWMAIVIRKIDHIVMDDCVLLYQGNWNYIFYSRQSRVSLTWCDKLCFVFDEHDESKLHYHLFFISARTLNFKYSSCFSITS